MPENDFKWVEHISGFDESYINSYNEEREEGYFLEVDIQYLENLHNVHHDLPFLLKRMKIRKFRKLVANLRDKEKYFIHIINLKQVLSHVLVLKKLHRVIQFYQKFWQKPFIDMNTDLREAKMISKKTFSS